MATPIAKDSSNVNDPRRKRLRAKACKRGVRKGFSLGEQCKHTVRVSLPIQESEVDEGTKEWNVKCPWTILRVRSSTVA